MAGELWFADLAQALRHLGAATLHRPGEQALNREQVQHFKPTALLALGTAALHRQLPLLGLCGAMPCLRVLIPVRDNSHAQAPLSAAERQRIEQTAQGAGADVWLSLHAPPVMQRSVGAWLETGKPLLFLPQAANPFRQGDQHSPKPYVRKAFEKYLECGIFAHGFARACCGDCWHDFLVAFSCNGRGVCPSCTTRRMAETAAHLTDHVFPRLSVRQWVLSVPKRLLYYMQRDSAVLSLVLRIFLRVI